MEYFFGGLVLGGIIAWFMAKFRFQGNQVSDSQIKANYIAKERYEDLEKRNTKLKQEWSVLNSDYLLVSKALAAKEQYADNLMDKLRTEKIATQQLQEQFSMHFENIANRLLEEKSQKFSMQNETQLNHILLPLKEKIRDFEEKIERNQVETAKERISLKEEIKHHSD